jgi:hypothetical protein
LTVGWAGLECGWRDTGHGSRPIRCDAALTSVDSVLLFRSCIEPLSSALERINDKLQDSSDHVENAGRLGNNEVIKDVSDLMDGVRSAVVECQVSDSNKISYLTC